MEWHSRPVDDWFTPTLALDVAAFAYAALFCQRVLTDDSAVDTLSAGRMLPAVDLLLLVVLFVNITLDRICYSVGSVAGKGALHVAEVPLYMLGTWLLCWSPRATATDRFHLRVRPIPSSVVIIDRPSCCCTCKEQGSLRTTGTTRKPVSCSQARKRHSLVTTR